jgi:hypothetical protein
VLVLRIEKKIALISQFDCIFCFKESGFHLDTDSFIHSYIVFQFFNAVPNGKTSCLQRKLEIADIFLRQTTAQPVFVLFFVSFFCGTNHSNDDLKMQKYQKWCAKLRSVWRESDKRRRDAYRCI